MKIHTLPSGRRVKLVPRHILRRATHGRTLSVPHHLKALAAKIPTPPGVFDGSKGRAVTYDIMGNGAEGDCYETDALHCIQTWLVNAGQPEPSFPLAAVLAEYHALSGGDNGLGDDQVFPHWKGPGFQGHKILDDLSVDPRDDAAIRLGMYLFCGASFTCALPDGWVNSNGPGFVWDVGTPDQANGHAMHLSGYVTKGQPMPFDVPHLGLKKGQPSPADYYFDETWGFLIPILLTPQGAKSADPELTVQFSLDMFDSTGFAPHCKMYYDQLAPLWHTLGGITLPPSPFGPMPQPIPVPPVPGPTPIPPAPTPIPAAAPVYDLILTGPIPTIIGRPAMITLKGTATPRASGFALELGPPLTEAWGAPVDFNGSCSWTCPSDDGFGPVRAAPTNLIAWLLRAVPIIEADLAKGDTVQQAILDLLESFQASGASAAVIAALAAILPVMAADLASGKGWGRALADALAASAGTAKAA